MEISAVVGSRGLMAATPVNPICGPRELTAGSFSVCFKKDNRILVSSKNNN